MGDVAGAYEVVVVGAGMAGHCAALEAARQGKSVLLLEKTAEYGGSTRMCGGAFAFAGTEVQKENGIEDSSALLEEDLLKAGKYRNDKELVRVYAEHQYEAYQWLKALGLHFNKVSLSGSQSVPRNHSTNPAEALAFLHGHCLSAGVTYRHSAPVDRLLTDGADANTRVVGVQLASGENISALGGVILATGGFSRSAEMVERFVPHLRNARPMGGKGNTGDGLRMAWALGADLIDMGYVKGSFGAPVDHPYPGMEASAPRLVSAMYRGAIIVNKQAQRFVDESLSYKTIGDRCLDQPEAVAFQIFDQKTMDQSAPLPTVADYMAAHAAGLVREASTIAELAEVLGLPPEELMQTVANYNSACKGYGHDVMGRSSLSSGYGKPAPLDTAQFYGIACTTGLTSTYCGLHTNSNAQVLDVYDRPIQGLYATGEVMGGFHGETYMSGSSLAKGCIFGRIAAQHASGVRNCLRRKI